MRESEMRVKGESNEEEEEGLGEERVRVGVEATRANKEKRGKRKDNFTKLANLEESPREQRKQRLAWCDDWSDTAGI
jgi:hypothetical protein